MWRQCTLHYPLANVTLVTRFETNPDMHLRQIDTAEMCFMHAWGRVMVWELTDCQYDEGQLPQLKVIRTYGRLHEIKILLQASYGDSDAKMMQYPVGDQMRMHYSNQKILLQKYLDLLTKFDKNICTLITPPRD